MSVGGHVLRSGSVSNRFDAEDAAGEPASVQKAARSCLSSLPAVLVCSLKLGQARVPSTW